MAYVAGERVVTLIHGPLPAGTRPAAHAGSASVGSRGRGCGARATVKVKLCETEAIAGAPTRIHAHTTMQTMNKYRT